MTASEQLAIWAEAPDDDILIGVSYDDEPLVVERLKARSALLSYEKRKSEVNIVRVAELNGVTCIVIEGNALNPPYAAYRAVMSSAEPFGRV